MSVTSATSTRPRTSGASAPPWSIARSAAVAPSNGGDADSDAGAETTANQLSTSACRDQLPAGTVTAVGSGTLDGRRARWSSSPTTATAPGRSMPCWPTPARCDRSRDPSTGRTHRVRSRDSRNRGEGSAPWRTGQPMRSTPSRMSSPPSATRRSSRRRRPPRPSSSACSSRSSCSPRSLMLAIALFRVLVVLTGEVWAAYADPRRNLRDRGGVRAGQCAPPRTEDRECLMLHELVIVGSGPAGLTAAVYAGRANLQPDRHRGHRRRRAAHAHHRRRELPRLPRRHPRARSS